MTYQQHKKRCGRKQSCLPKNQIRYIKQQIKNGWTPDTIIG